MSWNDIIGQDRVKKIIQKAILQNRIAHAYCFSGIEGIGKEGLAIEFAKTVNCNNPIVKDDTISACEQCQTCRNFATLTHQNIQLVFSLPAEKTTSDSKKENAISRLSDDEVNLIRDEIRQKALNYYHRIEIPNATQIRISSIRDIKRSLTLSSPTSGRRFIIIIRADEMTKESANAFLKTLEEPHQGITIILTTSKKELLLPTILSRCQILECEPLNEDLIANTLIKLRNIAPEDARLIAQFAQGSYSKALGFLGEDMKSYRELIVDALRKALRPQNFRLELLETIEQIVKMNDKNKYETILVLFILWLRDAYTIQKSKINEYIINYDNIDSLQRFLSKFSNKDLEFAIELVEKAIYQIKRNVQPQLIFINLFLKMREILLN